MPDIDPAELLEKLRKAPSGGVPDPTALWAKLSGKTEPETSKWEGLWEGLKRGGRDVLEGGAQIGARMMAAGPEEGAGAFDVPEQRAAMPGRVDQAAQESARTYQQNPAVQQHPLIAGAGRAGGNIAATAPLAAMPGGGMGIAGRMGMGAATGGIAAALQPVESDDYWTTKGKQIALGGAIGAAIPGVIGAFAPKGTAPGTAGQLAGAGVSLTPGMQLGPAARGFEKTLEAFPILRGMLQRGEAKTIDGFNKAAVAQAIEPIGATVPRNLQAGHGLIEFAKDKLSEAYDRVLPNVSFSETAWDGIKNDPQLMQMTKDMLSPDQRERLAGMLNTRVTERMQDGILTGEQFKRAESELSGLSERFHGTNDSALGDALHDVIMRMRNSLVDQNGEYGKELRNINSAYAMFTRVRNAAAAGSATSGGKFTPGDLARSARLLDPSAGKGGFAEGNALMQTFAEAADKTLGKVTPPGTTIPSQGLRALEGLLAIGGAGGAIGGGAPGAGIGAAAAGTLPYAAKAGMSGAAALGRVPGGAQPGLAGAAGMGTGRAVPQDRTRQRLKAAAKVGELSTQRHNAMRSGNFTEVEKIGQRLAEAQRDYRELGGTA